jgi:hypothetical protein
MNTRRFLFAIVGIWILTAGCAAASDVVPARAAARPAAPDVAETPAESQRNHVHVFLLNGLDPFFFCQFNKMPDYVRSLGYEHVYMGQMNSKSKFLEEIRRIRATDPCARIVLLGFSTGANTVCGMCHTLKDDGCKVDLLIYLGGCWIFNWQSSRPENALQIVNIRDSGLVTFTGGLLHGDDVDGAENIKIPGFTLHIMTPVNPVTQDTLARELNTLAAGVSQPATPAPVDATAPAPAVKR